MYTSEPYEKNLASSLVGKQTLDQKVQDPKEVRRTRNPQKKIEPFQEVILSDFGT